MYRNTCGTGGFCGLCYEGAKGRAYHRGHYGYCRPRQRRLRCQNMPLKRRGSPLAGGTAAGVPRQDEFRGRWPALWEFLSEDSYEDGTPRRTGTILLFAESGVAKVMLKDRDAGLIGWVSGQGFEAALDAADVAVGTSSGDWRPDHPPSSKKAR